jgi:hypothetical protein
MVYCWAFVEKYNVTLRRVRLAAVVVEGQYYIF